MSRYLTHLAASTAVTATLMAGFVYAVTEPAPASPAVAHRAYVDPNADLDTSVVTDRRGEPAATPDLTQEIGVNLQLDSWSDQEIGCMVANGAHGDATDGLEALYMTRATFYACNLYGWLR